MKTRLGMFAVATLAGVALSLACAREVRSDDKDPAKANGDSGGTAKVADQDNSKACGTISGVIHARKVKSARDVVVYIDQVADAKLIPARPVEMHQKGLIFQPRVLVVLKGTTVDFVNDDNVEHNVFSPDDVMDKADLGTYGTGEKRSFAFKKAGVGTMLCKKHPEMQAAVVVLNSAWFAVSEGPEKSDAPVKEATFVIKDVPAGTYTLKTLDPNGRLKEGTAQVTVQAGQEAKVTLELSK